ncbi:MAG: hypothetical protein Sapg2KO_13480 [Saprospiraceae bacterium]
MKTVKMLATIALLLTLSLGTWSCGGAENAQDSAATEIKHGEGKEHNSAYVCPMHCEGSGSDAAGECPTCGMAYVALEDHVENDHSH